MGIQSPGDVVGLVGSLPRKTKTEVTALWKEVLGTTPPRNLRRGLLIRILAYNIQERAYDGIRPEAQKRLRELGHKFAANSEAEIGGSNRIRAGTRLIREWQGKTHEVTALDRGFEYAGRQHGSLSEIARLITGTRWSGPLFFGMKEQADRSNAQRP